MREGAALVARHLREAARSVGARVLLVLSTLVLALVASATSGSTRVLAGFVLVGLVALACAAWAASLLPSDRRAGREAWLRTVAPSPGWHRAAAIAAGAVLGTGVAVGTALLLGVLLLAVDPALEIRPSSPLPALSGRRLPGAGAPLALVPIRGVPAVGGPWTLELDLGVRYHRYEDTGRALAVRRAGIGDAETTIPLAHRAPLRLPIAPGEDGLGLASATPGTTMRILEARMLGAPVGPLPTFLLAGLILGGIAAGLAAAGVAISRWTSGPTAGAVVLVLALAAVVHAGLDEGRARAAPAGQGLQSLGLEVVEASAALAPDVSVLGRLGEPARGRALDVATVLEGLLPVVLYALGGAVLAVLPLPRPGLAGGHG